MQNRMNSNWAAIGMTDFVNLSVQEEWSILNKVHCHLSLSAVIEIGAAQHFALKLWKLCHQVFGLTQQRALMFTDKKALEYIMPSLVKMLLNMTVEYVYGGDSLSGRFYIFLNSSSFAKLFQVLLLSLIHGSDFIYRLWICQTYATDCKRMIAYLNSKAARYI